MKLNCAFKPAAFCKPRITTLRARQPIARIQCSAATNDKIYEVLDEACDYYKRVPVIGKPDAAAEVREACNKLQEAGAFTKFNAGSELLGDRRPVSMGELKMAGVKNAEGLSTISVRNDAAFLIGVVGTTSVLAVILGQLPGDWGFFGAYLTGGISIVVLAIGSVNPAILQFAIERVSIIFPDFKERVLRHEAAHFLAAHVLGVPVVGYSLSLGKEHTDLCESALQRRIIAQQLTDDEVNRLAVIAMAGATSECMKYDEVIGQAADFMDLQRIMNRAEKKLSGGQQQSLTRWAAYEAAVLLRRYSKEYEALQEVMGRGGSVGECIKAIEQA